MQVSMQCPGFAPVQDAKLCETCAVHKQQHSAHACVPHMRGMPSQRDLRWRRPAPLLGRVRPHHCWALPLLQQHQARGGAHSGSWKSRATERRRRSRATSLVPPPPPPPPPRGQCAAGGAECAEAGCPTHPECVDVLGDILGLICLWVSSKYLQASAMPLGPSTAYHQAVDSALLLTLSCRGWKARDLA